MKRSFSLLLSIALAGGMLASCARHENAQPSQKNANILRINIGTEPPNMDPALMEDLVSYDVILPLMKGLTQFDPKMNTVPAIASRWDVSQGGTHYVFHLRPDAKWSDGKPVTANDFQFAWHRALDPAIGSPYAIFLYEIKNGKAFYDGKIKDFNQVGVHVADPHTLVVDLQRPVPFFTMLAACPVMLPVREDIVKKYGDQFTEAGNFVSNGAYKLQSWVHEEKIRMVPNPYFYEHDPAKRPGVAAVDVYMINDANTSVVMYENGELDFIETTTSIPAFDVRRLRKSPDAHTEVIHRINYFGFNTSQKPFSNVKVRQAFSHALNRDYYPRLMQSGQRPIASWITPGLIGYNAKVGLQYDPDKARKLLAEAGYPGGKGFPTVTLAFMTNYDVQKEAEIAQYQWEKELGVKVRLENMEWKVFLSRLHTQTPDMFRLGWFVDYPDPDSYMNVFLSDSGNNHTHWKSAEYDQLVGDAVLTLDAGKRQLLYDKAQKILLEKEAVMLPFYAAEKTWLAKPYVKGMAVNGLNLPDLDRVHIER